MTDSVADLAAIGRNLVSLHAEAGPAWHRTVEHLVAAEAHTVWMLDQLAGRHTLRMVTPRPDDFDAVRLLVRFLITQLDGLERIQHQLAIGDPRTAFIAETISEPCRLVRLARDAAVNINTHTPRLILK